MNIVTGARVFLCQKRRRFFIAIIKYFALEYRNHKIFLFDDDDSNAFLLYLRQLNFDDE